MTTDVETRRARILRGIGDTSSFPEVATRVLSMAENPDTSAADLARAISRDAVLTGCVIRASNSAAMASIQQITSLPDAILRLGLRQVRDIVVVGCLPNASQSQSTPTFSSIWRRSVGSAIAMRLMGLDHGIGDPDFCFLVGLFHDIGRFHLSQTFPKAYDQISGSLSASNDWTMIERQIFGIDHTELGETMLRSWDMDEQICHAAKNHHQVPSDLEGPALLVAAVDEILDQIEADDESEDELRTDSEFTTACERLALVNEERDEFIARIKWAIEQEIEFFSTAP